MQKKENEVSSDALAEKDACDRGIEEFKRWYPNDSATLTEVFRKLQILANTALNPLKYVDYAKWLVNNYPPTQETLVLNELTEKVIIHNGNIDIKSSIDGERFIIGNGDVNIKGGVKLTEWVQISAKNVKGQNITLYGYAGISAKGNIDVKNITAYGYADISAEETIKATNIAAYGNAGIWAYEINTQSIISNGNIYAKISLIQPSSN